MSKLFRGRMTFSNVVVLFVALGGSAYAATKWNCEPVGAIEKTAGSDWTVEPGSRLKALM